MDTSKTNPMESSCALSAPHRKSTKSSEIFPAGSSSLGSVGWGKAYGRVILMRALAVMSRAYTLVHGH